MTHFHIITLFPNRLKEYFNESILKKAQDKKKIKITYYDIRDFINDKKKRKNVDGKVYGGGPGMVMKAEPILRAYDKAKGRKKNVITILFTPRGEQFTNSLAKKISRKYKNIILICGYYEGIDSRIKKIIRPKEISIGPYILTGGEVPSMCVVDCVSRHIEGVLGNIDSIEENRISSEEMYTTPYEILYKNKKYMVPKVLLSGHHKEIDEYRKKKRKNS